MEKISATGKGYSNHQGVNMKIDLCGKGESNIDTGIPFCDHMLEAFAKHGFFDLEITTIENNDTICIHTIENLGIALGKSINMALGNITGIKRYGSCILPMDETLVLVAVDISGRPYCVYDLEPPSGNVRDVDIGSFKDFFYSLAVHSEMNLHIKLMSGEEIHHVFEAVFKALGKALDQAITIDPRLKGIMSTKGKVEIDTLKENDIVR